MTCTVQPETTAATANHGEAAHNKVSVLTEVKASSTEPYSAFSSGKRRFYMGIVTFAGFLGPLSGSIYLPLLPLLENGHHGELHRSRASVNGTVSIFMATFAVAPLFWASLADFGGRKILYLSSLTIFFVANILLVFFCLSFGALYPLRLFQAFGGASVMSLGAGTIVDLVPPKDRAFALSIFMLGPQVGPALGPLLGGIISQYAYRYVFALLAISTFVAFALILLCLPETLRYLVGNGSVYESSTWPAKPRLWQKRLVNDDRKYPRPPKPSPRAYYNLLRYVPTLLVCIDNALLFGGYYAFTVDFARTLEQKYLFNQIQIGASFIAPAGGMILGSLISGKLSDKMRAKFVKQSQSSEAAPERRIHSQIFGILISIAGFLMYGWFTRFHIHISSVLISTILAGFGMTWVFATSSAYLTECAPRQAASLVAVNGVFRNAAAAISSAVEGPVVTAIGTGWTFTIVALMYLVVVGIIIYLIRTGASWRRKREEWEKSSP
ncbi:MFS general substrate transporter [Xylona heveae TC161]|uniref:MFS general substrate transporter n=1 Tax=Xylona heveae (strain CBS 132557 / TC161) TaxID=1328760 RepID=A0A165ABV1_XYLHT|nr:MFS general substrate transporter [Xylona heveae TC161]KZF20228.1 MFS general substrate transporter [Xylona heveae TC161]